MNLYAANGRPPVHTINAVATEQARDLADVAADKLDRLAADIDTADSLTLSGAPEADRERARRTVVDSRNEAAGAMERLGAALTGAPHPGADGEDGPQICAWSQKSLVMHNATAEECRLWAAEWRAFADA